MKDNAGAFVTLKKVLKFIGRYRFLLVLSMILAAVSVILQLYIPILFGDAIDGIIGKGKVEFTLIASISVRILILIVLASLATWLMNLINNKLTYHTVRDIRAKAIRQIQHLPLSWLDQHSSGDIVQRIIADTDQLSDGLLLGFNQLFSGIVMIIATLVFMFSKNFEISILVVIMTPVSFFVAKFIASHSYQMFQKQNETRGKETALINEMIGGERVVKAFGYEERSSQRFRKLNEQLQTYTQQAVFYSSLTNPSTRAVNNVIYALVALVGGFRIIQGGLTVGGLTVLLSYANQYMKPFNDISSVVTELQNSLSCAARIFAMIEAEPESKEPVEELEDVKGDVSIENVSFSYDPEKPLIQNFNFHARPGETVAIVGPTGCGKTTFINLLMRFYDPDEGSINVDGKNTRNVTRHSLRRNIGMVLQETWLKHDTVRANIAFGKPDASDEEIKQAAIEAHAWDFIKRMPKGLDTVIDDDDLSQGQKQLLCIARVMLTKPAMLILDEATSNIDTRTELLVQSGFTKLMENRTSFTVAHRLSTIRNADQILVMKDGHIIEQGTHESLMKAGGFYKELYNSQFAGVSI